MVPRELVVAGTELGAVAVARAIVCIQRQAAVVAVVVEAMEVWVVRMGAEVQALTVVVVEYVPLNLEDREATAGPVAIGSQEVSAIRRSHVSYGSVQVVVEAEAPVSNRAAVAAEPAVA